MALRESPGMLEVGRLSIEPDSPWETGYGESSNGKVRDELLNPELFDAVLEVGYWQVATGSTTIQCGRTARWTTGRRLLRPSCRGRRVRDCHSSPRG